MYALKESLQIIAIISILIMTGCVLSILLIFMGSNPAVDNFHQDHKRVLTLTLKLLGITMMIGLISLLL